MSDIVADIRCHLQTMAPHQRARLTAEQLRKAADEIERLREAIRRLADQDATLSVQGGNVIVDMTDEKVVRLPSTFTASNVGGWVILALADSLNAAGVKWEVAEE